MRATLLRSASETMQRTTTQRAFHQVIALAMTVGVGGGCLAIYSFDAKPPLACTQADDCPGTDVCGQRICDRGVCGIFKPVAPGGVPLDEPRGDCRRSTCDGEGNLRTEVDDSDLPFDGNPCTDDICQNGLVLNPIAAVGTQCGAAPSVTCNATGACAGCTTDSDCGVNSPCVRWTCSESICLRVVSPVGTFVANPVAGDCRQDLCDETGESRSTFDPSDAPSDGDECTVDICVPNGDVTHDVAPDGTKCGNCASCAAGSCQACNIATSNCFNGECVLKPQPCTNGSDCASSYCVDGYCCNTECSAQCMACSEAKTGQPSGLCRPVVNGTDPDDDCADLDICIAGGCQCQNGVRDATEFGVDCGGTCAPCSGVWKCGDVNPCEADPNPECCALLCFDCSNEKLLCESFHGQSCILGTPANELSLGVTSAAGCKNSLACKKVRCECQ